MATWKTIDPSIPLSESRQIILDNNEVARSGNAGYAFPENNLLLGMPCFRIDEMKTYTLVSLDPVEWKVVHDFSQDRVYLEDVAALVGDKQEKITGAATSIAQSNLTPSKILISDSDGKIAASDTDVSAMELVSTLTDNAQDQLDNKVGIDDTVSDSLRWNGSAFTISEDFPAGGTHGDVWFKIGDVSDDTSPSSKIEVFQQNAAGTISMESWNNDGLRTGSTYNWTKVSAPIGFSGLHAYHALPDAGEIAIDNNANIDFYTNFVTNNDVYINIRGLAPNVTSNSFYVVIDDDLQSAVSVNLPHTGETEYVWSDQTYILNVGTIGYHKISILIKDTNVIFDKIVLKTTPDSESGFGAAESIRVLITAPSTSADDPWTEVTQYPDQPTYSGVFYGQLPNIGNRKYTLEEILRVCRLYSRSAAETYSVKKDGTGTFTTIAQANAVVRGGEVVRIYEGDYGNDPIAPQYDGDADNPIFYVVNNLENVTITPISPNSAIDIQDRKHVHVVGYLNNWKFASNATGLKLLGTSGAKYINAQGSEYCSVQGVDMRGATEIDPAIEFKTSKYFGLINNHIEGAIDEASTIGSGAVDHLLVTGNRLLGSSNNMLGIMGDGPQTATKQGFVVYDNYFASDYANGLNILDCYSGLVKDNYFDYHGNGQNQDEDPSGQYSMKTHNRVMSIGSGRIIVTGNIFRNAGSYEASWIHGIRLCARQIAGTTDYYVFDCVFYNNTFDKMFGSIFEIGVHNNAPAVDAESYYGDNEFFNNIFSNTVAGNNSGIFDYDGTASNVYTGKDIIENNIIQNINGVFIYYDGSNIAANQTADNQHFVCQNNIVATPLYSAEDDTNGYWLTGQSAGKDVAREITTIVGTGSGVEITVASTKAFTAGFGLILGDAIKIGNHLVRVWDVDKENSKIRVSKSVNWVDGQGIYPWHADDGPDIGARQ